MRFDVVTLFPEIFESALSKGIVGQNISDENVELKLINLRNFSETKYKHVDDRPFGGGDGMILSAGPLTRAIRSVDKVSEKRKVVYLSPQGRKLSDRYARELSELDQLVLICGRYGGVDERVIASEVDEELSIGDYVLSGGEYGALVVIDVIARLLPGVLGNEDSRDFDTFSDGLLEAPQFTRPRVFEGSEVPSSLLNGNHKEIEDWRFLLSVLRTSFRRPDLIEKSSLTELDIKRSMDFYASLSYLERRELGLPEEIC